MTTVVSYIHPAPRLVGAAKGGMLVGGNKRRTLWEHRGLIAQMARREVVGRYRGSVLGIGWSLMHPLLMLAVYTFVFGYLWRVSPRAGLKAGGAAGIRAGDVADFALFAFAGMTVFGIASETLNRATTAIVNNPSYVKKVVFPLETLPVIYLASALVHAVASVGLLALANLAWHHTLPWTIVIAPFALIPLVLMVLGISWMLAAVGAYLRDISHMTAVAMMALIYVSPVFYSMEAAESRHWWLGILLRLNPLTVPLENFRAMLLGPAWGGSAAPWVWTASHAVVSLFVAGVGFRFFQRAKRGFADVV